MEANQVSQLDISAHLIPIVILLEMKRSYVDKVLLAIIALILTVTVIKNKNIQINSINVIAKINQKTIKSNKRMASLLLIQFMIKLPI